MAISVVDFSLKPNCSLVNIFSIKKQFNLLCITFLIIFEKEGKSEMGR